MRYRYLSRFILIVIILLAVLTACHSAPSVQELEYGFDREVSEEEKEIRTAFVTTAEGWLGASEGTDQHKEILSIYNTYEPLAQGYIVTENDKWCATFVSAVAIQCDLTHIIPTECGCQRQIGLFEELGRWEENDAYVPLPGDIIYYSSKDSNATDDCTGWSDHVGIVVGTCNGYIKVIEGNSNKRVEYRYIEVDSIGIRGYALPEFDS